SARAPASLDGWICLARQTGSPRSKSRPWRLIAISIWRSWGNASGSRELLLTVPATRTVTGTAFARGRVLGWIAPSKLAIRSPDPLVTAQAGRPAPSSTAASTPIRPAALNSFEPRGFDAAVVEVEGEHHVVGLVRVAT